MVMIHQFEGNIMSGHKAFNVLRPFCVKVAEEPSVESVNRLQQELVKVSSEDLQVIQEYVIFPLKLALLRDGRQEGITIALLNCLRSLLSLTELTNWQLFMDLFLKLFLLISSKDTEIKVRDCSEDLKLAVVECLKTLVEKTSNDVKKSLYDPTFCPALGHGVYILLQLSQNECLRSLRVVSMKTLNLMFGLTSDLSSKPDADRSSLLVQARLAAFLPGICITMQQVATADVKQGHAVAVAALETWGRVVVFCLSSPEEDDRSKDVVARGNGVPRVPEVKRTRDWITSTASKLQILLKRMLQLVSHPHHRVRLTLANLVALLLLHCRSSFQDSFVSLSECIISLMNDDMDSIRKRSREVIADLSSQNLDRPLVDTLEDSVYSLATRLPRLLRNTDEKEKLVALNLLSGYVSILDSRTESLLRSSSHLKRLSQALIHISQPDTKNVPLVLPSVGTENSLYLKFQHFTDSSVFESLKQSCVLLGQQGDTCVLVDCFLDVVQNNCAHREGAVLILNSVAAGVALRENLGSEAKDAIKHAFDVYTSPWLWEDERKIILKGLLLEGIVKFVQILDDSRSYHVEDLLCIFLEQAGSSSSWVAQAAKTSLGALAKIQKHSSVDDLICSNTDYLIHSLCLKLVHYTEYPALPPLLTVLFTSVNQNNLLLFHDIIQRILMVVDAVYGGMKSGEFLGVLHSLVKVLSSHFPSVVCSHEPHLPDEVQETSRTLRDFIVQRQEALTSSENIKGMDSITDDCVNQNEGLTPETVEDSPETKENKPLHVQITCQVLKRCVHLLRMDDMRLVLTSLDVVQSGMTVLADHEDDILPIVHELWEPFKDLFQPRSSPVVIYKAFETLLLMAKICKGFIRKRTLDCVWPLLMRLLEKQAEMSRKKENSSHQMNKLTALLLSELGQLACLLELRGSEFENLCQICLSFLETDTRVPIVKACSETLSWLQKLDCDAIWWWMTRASCALTNIPSIPGQEFRTLHLPVMKPFPESSVIVLQELLENKLNT